MSYFFTVSGNDKNRLLEHDVLQRLRTMKRIVLTNKLANKSINIFMINQDLLKYFVNLCCKSGFSFNISSLVKILFFL